MEFENTVNDVQEGVVDLPNDTPEFAASEAGEQGAASPEQRREKPMQTSEENSAFASMRRENERLQREMRQRDELLKRYFPETEEPYLSAQLQALGMSREQLEAEYAAFENQQRKEAELEELRRFRADSTFEKDLSAIRAAYPDVQAGTIEELGADYLRIMAQGGLDAVTAYEIARAKEEKARRNAPSEIGKVNSTGGPDKSYFTRDEVRAMSQDEVHRYWDKIRTSRSKWK